MAHSVSSERLSWMKIASSGAVSGIALAVSALVMAQAHWPSGGSALSPPVHEASSTGCESRPQSSRWAAGVEAYRATRSYGAGDDEWLATVAGLVTQSDRVLVYDEGRSRVVELSPTLEPIGAFGRKGQGPGEISRGLFKQFLPRYWDYQFLGADSDAIVVYDGREIEVFGPGGEFAYQIRPEVISPPFSYGVRYVHPVGPDQVLFVNDSIDMRGRRPRHLQVWSVSGRGRREARRLLWQVRLPWEPEATTRLTVRAREARPFWAATAGCQVATDGFGPSLIRYDEISGTLDSLSLPAWEVPKFGSHADDRPVAVPHGRAGRAGDAGGVRDLIRWTGLRIDPDGYAWIQAWTPFRADEITAFVVSLDTGVTTRVELPAFPHAFGEPGVFFTVSLDPSTEQQLITRYVAN